MVCRRLFRHALLTHKTQDILSVNVANRSVAFPGPPLDIHRGLFSEWVGKVSVCHTGGGKYLHAVVQTGMNHISSILCPLCSYFLEHYVIN